MPSEPSMDPNLTTCANCHSPMPRELRFCRNCGYRLGEGIAEYTETVRFADAHAGVMGNRSTANGQPLVTSYGLSGSMAQQQKPGQLKKRKRLSGMTWIFLGLLVFFIVAAGFTALITPMRQAGVNIPGAPPVIPRSYFGVDGFRNTDEGVTFDTVDPPGSPADKAGLVGGDIITHFDGQEIKEEDQITELLRRTPVGKTVDIVYVRDGETKTTKLTTVSRQEFDRLAEVFRRRPEGRGRFGYDDDRTERVAIPGTKMFGVRLEEGAISASLPADMAGIKDGDIILEFDGVPIRTEDELSSRVRRAIPYSTIKVVLMRGTEKLEIPVKIGRQ